MKKILIGTIVAALGGAFGTVYFAVKYRKEVKNHWDTMYRYEDELRETEKYLKGKTKYDAWDLEFMMDDLSDFILNHKNAINDGIERENEELEIFDDYDQWELEEICKTADTFQKEYKKAKEKEKEKEKEK
jgi:gas vesicle protein